MRKLFVIAALVLATTATASTQVVGPGATGFCTVSTRREVGLAGRSLVVCRYNTVDLTGDGTPEVIEQVLVLKRNGGLDCERSFVNTLDVTRDRHQAIFVKSACE